METDRRLARAFARTFPPRLAGPPIVEPSVDDVAAALAGAANSALGPDGLPYVAWRQGGEPATRVLLALYRSLSTTGVAPPLFGASVAVFLPKGDMASDGPASGRRDRMASQTRPLALCNSDRRTIAAMANQRLRQRLPRSTPMMQCGFVKGRITITQIVGLEAEARQATILATSSAVDGGWLPPPPPPVTSGAAAARRGTGWRGPCAEGQWRKGMRRPFASVAAPSAGGPPRPPARGVTARHFLDFAMAFPSVSRPYMLDTLAAAGAASASCCRSDVHRRAIHDWPGCADPQKLLPSRERGAAGVPFERIRFLCSEPAAAGGPGGCRGAAQCVRVCG